jgi:iron complex transport system ATP-binding protein
MSGVTLAAGNVTVRLNGRAVLVRINVSLSPGGLIALVGPNGAGKSTLLKALAGLIVPSEGTIEIGTKPLQMISANDRARLIAYLPQSRVIHWPMSVRNIVALGRLAYSATTATAREQDSDAVNRAMIDMDVADFAGRPVLELSGGEQARVLMARALAQNAPILLADEPAAGLDPAHQLQLFEALRRTAHGGKTVVVATHDLSLAARYCAHVVVMKQGRIAVTGKPADALSAQHLAEVYGISAKTVVVDGVPAIVPIGVNARPFDPG